MYRYYKININKDQILLRTIQPLSKKQIERAILKYAINSGKYGNNFKKDYKPSLLKVDSTSGYIVINSEGKVIAESNPDRVKRTTDEILQDMGLDIYYEKEDENTFKVIIDWGYHSYSKIFTHMSEGEILNYITMLKVMDRPKLRDLINKFYTKES